MRNMSRMSGITKTSIDTIRTLSMDAVQAANSGHPGTPMALAPVAYELWQKHLNYDPQNPTWANRDRFVLSIGHASTLLYSMLHLAGVNDVDENGLPVDAPAVTLEDIKNFRQLDSKCPGHPEYRWTSGVEMTTGPLGQGVATSVGMAIASKWQGANYSDELINYNVYALCGDGCMMEGIASEAASLAGHLKLANLCWIYDSNHITIEGDTDLAFTEDVAARFVAYGWNVLHVDDANDLDALNNAFDNFKKETAAPTFIVVKSHIGYGSPNKQDTHGAHGAPLGDEEIKLTKQSYGWQSETPFFVPDGVREDFQSGIGKRGAVAFTEWTEKFEEYQKQNQEKATELHLMQTGKLPANWEKDLPEFPADAKGDATRNSSGKVLNAVAKNIPWLIGGSADLAPSTKTTITDEAAGAFQAETPAGRNFHFGVREHAMSAIISGMTLCGLRGYGSGFMIFSDYARGAIRLAAMMELPTIHIFTHDSIGVGEDGPTHQPVEQLMSLRLIPDMMVFRPADANEVVEAWRTVMPMQNHPVALILTRQNLPTLDRTTHASASGVARGAYVLKDAPNGKPDVLLLASGSEVSLCLEAQEELATEGIQARVISMPCWELFEQQDDQYKESVLPASVTARVSVEAGSTLGWERYIGLQGRAIGMTTFGASAPLSDLLKKFGFTIENVVAHVKDVL
ncbi:Transketolase [hydrothermal vent metagenome]|uniref:transketolase n=1 Tax=hydrothermal vent metagenome TaxID=652676 RepID=A0A3B1DWL7_9ZZZZ